MLDRSVAPAPSLGCFPSPWTQLQKGVRFSLKKEKWLLGVAEVLGQGLEVTLGQVSKEKQPIKSLRSANAWLGKYMGMELRCSGWTRKGINSQENARHIYICMKRTLYGKNWL